MSIPSSQCAAVDESEQYALMLVMQHIASQNVLFIYFQLLILLFI